MKRSTTVTLTLVTSVALAACGDTRPRSCVASDESLVPEANCEQQEQGRGGAGYHYYYGGSAVRQDGRLVMRGGSMGEMAGSVSRGAFGRIGGGFHGGGE
jgi:hypothetical protein